MCVERGRERWSRTGKEGKEGKKGGGGWVTEDRVCRGSWDADLDNIIMCQK